MPQRPTRTDRRLGTLLDGRFRLEAVLGVGGCGTTYRARQVVIDRPVAVKVLHPWLNADLSQVARFQQEARAMASLRHPNTVVVHDFGQTPDGASYLVTELLEGEPLSAVLAREGRLARTRVISLGRQILRSLVLAHAAGIIHRDLKPDNLFVTRPDGAYEVVKVLDFGIAKVTGDAATSAVRTKTGAIMGTPAYMSPEQCRTEAVLPQSDLYALGAVLYEALTGRRVFERSSAIDMIVAHATAPPEPPSIDGVPIGGPVAAFILRCLAKDPADRPASAEVALRELSACATGATVRPVRRRDVRAATRLHALPSRSSRLRGFLRAAVVAIALGLGFGAATLADLVQVEEAAAAVCEVPEPTSE